MTFRTRCSVLVLALTLLVLLWSTPVLASVQAVFHLDHPSGGPFPSDRFTVEDETNNTGLAVALPKPDCATRPSDCADLDVINTLDGFSLRPRLSIPFDGPIDLTTATSQTVFLLRLRSARDDDREEQTGERAFDRRRINESRDDTIQIIGINRVVWDPLANTLHAESDDVLDQHTRYTLIVTDGVHDLFGAAVKASEEFWRFRHSIDFGHGHDQRLKAYRKELLEALEAARDAGISGAHIAVASVFTTESVTAVMERIRDQVHADTPQPADFLLGPGRTRTVFPLSEVKSVIFNQQIATAPLFNQAADQSFSLRLLPGAPDVVGQIAFGKYISPDYETSAKVIPHVATRAGVPAVQRTAEVVFNLFTPSGPKPPRGWPVAIWGHGRTDSKEGFVYTVAASMAANGIATIAINVVGHGFGPLSTLTVNRTSGPAVTFLSGGRGIDQDGDGVIDSTEGLFAAPPQTIIGPRDGQRQTVVDLMQLVRVIQVGMDLDGDGVADLDPSRIYYFGQSLGGNYGIQFLALEPNVRAGVPNVPGGPWVEVERLGALRFILGQRLAARVPSLINVPDPTGIVFNENLPLRNQLPLTNTVPGAMEIQEVIDHTAWVSMSGDPLGYVSHIRRHPLDGVEAKPVIIQFAKGDETVPNPTTTALLRAGDLADRATLYRNDLAHAANPTVPKNPHFFILRIVNPVFRVFAFAAQHQIAEFFASDGQTTFNPGLPFFEVPVIPPLPEDLAFLP